MTWNSTSDFEQMPAGTIVTTGRGNRWRKREDGLWSALSDRGFGPHTSRELPGNARTTEQWAVLDRVPFGGAS